MALVIKPAEPEAVAVRRHRTPVRCRRMTSADTLWAARVEALSFPRPWTAGEFEKVLRMKNAVGLVAEDARLRPLGFCLYATHPTSVQLLNLAVDPRARRAGVGRQIVAYLAARVLPQVPQMIGATARVSEWNLRAQVFYRACGWRWEKTFPGYYGVGDDAYLMVYRAPRPAA